MMNKVHFPAWANEIDEAVIEINRVTSQIQNVGKRLKTHDITKNDFDTLCENLCETLGFWTGSTYVGVRKDKKLQKAFQRFFKELYPFLIYCTEEEIITKNVLYRGKLYRYIGHGSCNDNTVERIEPEYNDIYVSWSKKPNNHYIQSKLYGTMTLLTCEIPEPYYGIDLEAFGVVRGNEAEVVFPTIQEMIIEVQYIDEED